MTLALASMGFPVAVGIPQEWDKNTANQLS